MLLVRVCWFPLQVQIRDWEQKLQALQAIQPAPSDAAEHAQLSSALAAAQAHSTTQEQEVRVLKAQLIEVEARCQHLAAVEVQYQTAVEARAQVRDA